LFGSRLLNLEKGNVMRLVVVESPAKAKTINKYLGTDYKVLASYGHIRDLLSKDGSVQPDRDFSMVWEISARGKKCVQDIAKELKNCNELLLATDPDREGEAISWHIKEVLQGEKKLKIPFRRIVFHEISKNAIKDAIANPRDIDLSLVDAYLARRALDYLVGFTLSPILWRKLPGSKSAGRVQSVALRIIAEREAEIEAFEKKEYWSIEAKFEAKNKKIFDAKLTHYNGKKLDKFSIVNAEKANSVRDSLLSGDFSVISVESQVVKRNPSPAFITSTIQQEASRKLGFGAKKTMLLAQNLYEGIDVNGETTALITYMRTDSINLSSEAVGKIRDLISKKYEKDFLPEKPRTYHTKVKNAQEAHEAIRPVDVSITPELLKGKISQDLYKLYDLVWKRAVASQMSSAELNQVQVDISDDKKNIFRANGSVITFDGFLKVYVEGKDDQEDKEEGILPPLAMGDKTPLKNLEALQHFTAPPPRFSEASLVKKLEELGIGRPSTYATTLQVLQDRGYVRLVKKFFVPEIRGRLVTVFLLNFFSRYLEYDFTADLEQSLDDISNGKKNKLEILKDFWNGFCANVDQTKSIKISDVINKLNESLESLLFADKESKKISRVCPECQTGELSLKISRFGSFIGCSNYPECKFVKRLDSSAMAENDNLATKSSEYPKFIGVDPSDHSEINLKKGPYGIYIQKDKKSEKGSGKKDEKKPIRISVPKNIDPNSIDISLAISLLQLPKTLGKHNGDDIKVGIGRYGPYVFFKGKYNSIPKTHDVLSLTLESAVQLIKK
jgi:DNA topoisomerase-1